MRLLGLDPGLRATGWGVIDVDGNSLHHVSDGTVKPAPDGPLAGRLSELYGGLRSSSRPFVPMPPRSRKHS